MTKDLKGMVKDLIRMQLTKKLDYCCDIQHFKIITRIMTDNILPGHTKFLGIPYNFYNIYSNNIYPNNIPRKFYHLFDNASHVILHGTFLGNSEQH